mgnify:CR=1 FL=1
MAFDELANRVVGCAIEVHRHLGPGLLESTYEQCLAAELTDAEVALRHLTHRSMTLGELRVLRGKTGSSLSDDGVTRLSLGAPNL